MSKLRIISITIALVVSACGGDPLHPIEIAGKTKEAAPGAGESGGVAGGGGGEGQREEAEGESESESEGEGEGEGDDAIGEGYEAVEVSDWGYRDGAFGGALTSLDDDDPRCVGLAPPTVLVSSISAAAGLIVDGDAVISMTGVGLERFDLSAQTITLLDSGWGFDTVLAGGFVYFADVDLSLKRAAARGGRVERVVRETGVSGVVVAADVDDVYWTNQINDAVTRHVIGTHGVSVVAETPGPFAMMIDDENIYWVADWDTGMKMPRDGSSEPTVLFEVGAFYALAAGAEIVGGSVGALVHDDDDVFIGAHGFVGAIGKNGDHPRLLAVANNPWAVGGIAVDDNYVYYTDYADDAPSGSRPALSRIERVRKAGGAAETVACNLVGPTELVVTDGALTFLDLSDDLSDAWIKRVPVAPPR